MEVLLVFIVCIIILAIWGLLANAMAEAAALKGHSQRKYFHLCFWLGLPAFLVVIALPDLTIHQQLKALIGLLEKKEEQPSTTSPSAQNNWTLPPI